MTDGEQTGLITVAAALVVAAIGALWKAINLILHMDELQTRYRHDLRNELNIIVQSSEERISDRLARLEQYSTGFQRHVRDENRGQGHD